MKSCYFHYCVPPRDAQAREHKKERTKETEVIKVRTNGVKVFFSVVFTPSPPSHNGSVLAGSLKVFLEGSGVLNR
jgi:hypothetical protein